MVGPYAFCYKRLFMLTKYFLVGALEQVRTQNIIFGILRTKMLRIWHNTDI